MYYLSILYRIYAYSQKQYSYENNLSGVFGPRKANLVLIAYVSSEGSGETARMRRLALTFAARIGDKNQIRLTRPKFGYIQQCSNFSGYPDNVSLARQLP